MTPYYADLHIHTLLSPCGEIEMIPSLIVESAKRAGLDIIAIADHNSCENAGAVIEAAEGSGIRVLPGLEVQSAEGIHLLCLFDEIGQATELQQAVYASLPSPPLGKEGAGGVDKLFAEQMIVDSRDEFVGYCERLLALPTRLSIDDLWQRVENLNGILIPSHIDRSGTGLCDILGMVPDEPDFPAVEISRNLTPLEARATFPSIGTRTIVCNSDSHWLSTIGERRTTFHIKHRTVAEIKLACRAQSGRRVNHA
jgi:3',5'-nucleoside bisphosphate phosphatase